MEVGDPVPGPDGGAWPLTGEWRMRLWWALPVGEPRPLQEHDELRWLTAARVSSVPWLSTNAAVVEHVSARLLPG